MKNLIFFAFSIIILANFTSCKKGLDGKPAVVDSLKVGLIAYYPFDNTGVDLSGNGNDATVFNITSTTDRFGIANNAYLFDGVRSYMSVNDNKALRLNNTDFTLTAWVNLTSFNSTSGSFVLCKRTSGLNDGWGFSITGYGAGLGVIGGVFFGPGGGNTYAVSTKNITTGKWYMVTVAYNFSKQQVSVYINGVLDSVTSNIPTPNAAITTNMYIGTDNPINYTNYFLNGSLCNVGIYSRALSSSQILKLYNLTSE